MTDAETREICRWLINRRVPTIWWPDRTQGLSHYLGQPSPPTEVNKKEIRSAYCYQKKVFWVARTFYSDAEYFGPNHLLEDLQVLMLMESL